MPIVQGLAETLVLAVTEHNQQLATAINPIVSQAMNPTRGPEALAATAKRLKDHVDRRRLLAIADRLIAVPSPTGRAGAAAEALAAILTEEGFAIDRPAAGHPDACAVVARLEGV